MTNQTLNVNAPFVVGTIEHEGRRRPVAVAGDRWHDLSTMIPDTVTTVDLFDDWEANLDRIEATLTNSETTATTPSGSLNGVEVLPPVQPIGPVLAAGANYREHILQMSVAHRLGREDASEEELWAEAAQANDERRAHGDPYVWTGIPSAVSGAYDDVQLPEVGDNIDWELELGVVIGRRGHHVAAGDANDYIAGYTIVNDISARSLIPRPDIANLGTDWFRGKNQPTFFPTGPWLVPARYVADPADLRITLKLNGQVMQDARTDDLMFDVPSLVAYVSSYAIIQPGDLLITGSPAGNGSHWNRFLQDGDVMECEITGLGVQRTEVRGRRGVLPPWQRSRR